MYAVDSRYKGGGYTVGITNSHIRTMQKENFEMHVLNNVERRDVTDRNEVEKIKTTAVLTAAVIGLLVLLGEVNGKKETSPNPNIPFEVLNTSKEGITFRQDGKDYFLETKDISAEVRASLITQRPDLESFLTNGPIHIAK